MVFSRKQVQFFCNHNKPNEINVKLLRDGSLNRIASMETTKENQPQLLPQQQITVPSTSSDKPTSGIIIKSEVTENSNDLQQAFSPNLYNASLPLSSASARIAQMIRAESLIASPYRGKRKNKTNGSLPFEEGTETGKPPHDETKQCEVLKAAKSLFSKRTRTLYHWMYPTASKQQLKLAIINSWETLSLEEKEFYISQVLGRFGFSKRSLMVNPQLSCMNNLTELPSFPVDVNFQASEETRNAVSSILNESKPRNLVAETAENGSLAKKRKVFRPTTGRRGRSKKSDVVNKVAQEVVAPPDEFQDDPELSREFQQFKWAFGMTNTDGR